MIAATLLLAHLTTQPKLDLRMQGAYREERAGWVCLHIQGPPRQLGFQNGSLASAEFDDFNKVLKLYLEKTTEKDWPWYREIARTLFWPKLSREYREEIQGIAEGLQYKGYTYDYIDVTAQNAWIEISDYYLPWMIAQKKTVGKRRQSHAPESCSAIIATGNQTADGKIVVCHTAWDDYLPGQRMNMIIDMKPEKGNRVIMDSMPGLIHSLTDFYVNSAGLIVTETTIGDFTSFTPTKTPEFERVRRAIQYGNNIDEFVRLISAGDNGGYANVWLIGDTKTNEIGKLELGLKNITFYRSHDGAYDSENFIDDPKMIREETTTNLWTFPNTCSDRRARWLFLMQQDMGKMDAERAEGYMGDHFNQPAQKILMGGLVLCSHLDDTTTPEIPGASAPRPFGSNQAKVCTTDLARGMSFWARMGHGCGTPFAFAPWVKNNPSYAWQAPLFRDLKDNPWTLWKSKW